MSKGKKHQQTPQSPKPTEPSKPAAASKTTKPAATLLTDEQKLTKQARTNKWIAAIVVMLISFAVFVNSKDNQFVLDDHGIIKANKITKAGISMDNLKVIFTTALRKGDVTDLENSLYRPLVKAIFAAEWQYSNGNPAFFHKVNIFFYVICCLLAFLVMYHALKKNWLLAMAIAILYAVHPLHSEVVANVKSLDEILSMIGVLLAVRCTQIYVDKNKMYMIPLAFISILIGMFSKESTVVAIGLIPLVLYYFHNANTKQLVIAGATMAIAFAFFYICRDNAIGKFGPMKPPSALDNVLALTREDPMKLDSYMFSKKFPTVVYLMGYYVYKLFFPLYLSCDYSYASVEVQTFSSPLFWASFIFFAIIIAYAVITIKQKSTIGFGIWWFLISSSIISNLFIVIGTSFGDRLMFTPSFGWAVAIAALAYQLFGYAKQQWQELSFSKSIQKHGMLALVVLLFGIPFSIKAYQRNHEWRRDRVLFEHDIKYYPNSTHLMFYWGNHISSNEYAERKSEDTVLLANMEAISTFRRSLSFFPALPSDGYNQLGKAFYNLYKGNIAAFGAMNQMMKDALTRTYGQIVPDFFDSTKKYRFLDSANSYYLKAHSEDTTNPVFMNNLGTVYFEQATRTGRVELLDSAERYFVGAHRRDSTVIDYMNNLGALVGTKGQPLEAIKWLYKAYKSDSLSLGAVLSCKMIGGTYRNLGDSVNSRAWYQQAANIELYRKQQEEALQ